MEHPRIAQLRSQVLGLPLDEHYRAVLLESIEYFRDQIVARPRYAPHECWDDLEALQQTVLDGMMERALQEKFRMRYLTAQWQGLKQPLRAILIFSVKIFTWRSRDMRHMIPKPTEAHFPFNKR
jgi:hypothetical protein